MNITLFPSAPTAITPNGGNTYVVANVKRDSASTYAPTTNIIPLRTSAAFNSPTTPAADLLSLYLQEQEAQSTGRTTAQNPYAAASSAYTKADSTDIGGDLGFIYSRVL